MSDTPKVLIWGAGGHGSVVLDILRSSGKYEPAAWMDTMNKDRAGTQHLGLPVFTEESAMASLQAEGVTHFVVAVGHCKARGSIAQVGEDAGMRLIQAAIHPSAVVADSSDIGDGSVVAAQAVVGPGVRIGRNAIINHAATVDHDCVLGDNVHICPGVHMAGHVEVGSQSWIGIGACVIDRQHIGADVVVGAGAVVVRDIPPGTTAKGVPAR